MSTDTRKPRRTEIRPDRITTAQLLAAAAKDTDAVSVFGNGTSAGDTSAAIFIVKGAHNVEYLMQVCARQGLLTPGKAVDQDGAKL